jgi:hypothetical protein
VRSGHGCSCVCQRWPHSWQLLQAVLQEHVGHSDAVVQQACSGLAQQQQRCQVLGTQLVLSRQHSLAATAITTAGRLGHGLQLHKLLLCRRAIPQLRLLQL